MNRGEEAALEWLISRGELAELATAIAAQGYFPGEPVLVCPCDADDPAAAPPANEEIRSLQLLVVEGNRRLAAVKMLRNPEAAPLRKKAFAELAANVDVPPPDTLPVIAFGHRDHILRYLGFRHVKGVKEWKPWEKARYLVELRRAAAEAGEDASNAALARRIGSTSGYVGRLITTLLIFEYVHAEIRDAAFSLLTTALSYTTIREWAAIEIQDPPNIESVDQERVHTLATWLLEKQDGGKSRIGESRNLRFLAQIVTDEEAISAFENGARPQQAALISQRPNVIVPAALGQAKQPLEIAYRRLEGLTEATSDTRDDADSCRVYATAIAEKVYAVASNGVGPEGGADRAGDANGADGEAVEGGEGNA